MFNRYLPEQVNLTLNCAAYLGWRFRTGLHAIEECSSLLAYLIVLESDLLSLGRGSVFARKKMPWIETQLLWSVGLLEYVTNQMDVEAAGILLGLPAEAAHKTWASLVERFPEPIGDFLAEVAPELLE